jgi:hypothetical protein
MYKKLMKLSISKLIPIPIAFVDPVATSFNWRAGSPWQR